jgi:hypothetical protein
MGPQDITVDTDPADSKSGKIAVGTKVMGLWGDRNWYPGEITEGFGRVWHVRFDDGDQAWLSMERLKVGSGRIGKTVAVLAFLGILAVVAIVLAWANVTEEVGPAAEPLPTLPMAPLAGPLIVGSRVLAPFGEGNFYFVGTVQALRDAGQVEVLFLDGDHGVVPSAALRADNVGPGTLVHAQSSSGDGWYAGQVRERDGDRVHVSFDDGDVEWVLLHRVRMVAQVM